MQSQESKSRNADALSHPNAAEWMGYLYREVTSARKRELDTHLSGCTQCREQLAAWRASLSSLDQWQLPVRRRERPRWEPAMIWRWAPAATLLLTVGLVVGWQGAKSSREVAALKTSVAQLTETLESERQSAASHAANATVAAKTELLSLLNDYAKLVEANRLEDRRIVAGALREMDSRLVKLRTELETVAVNTENGFLQTKQGLTQLASYTLPDRTHSVTTPPDTESKNQ